MIAALALLQPAFPVAGAEPSGPSPVDTPVELKLKWTVGQRVVQRQQIDQQMDFAMPGANESMHQTMTQSQDFSVTALQTRPGGGHELEVEFVAQKMELKMGDATMISFDSSAAQKDESNPVVAMMSKLIGARLKLFTDSQGQVEKTEGFKELMAKLSTDGQPQVKMMMEAMLSEDNVKRLGVLPQGLPGKPVKSGDQWPVKTEMAMGPLGTMVMDMQYQLAGWETHETHRCLRLDFTGTITSKASGETNAMNISIENGKTVGKLWFDPALGLPIDTAADQDMTMKVSASGQDISMKMKQKVSNKLVEPARSNR